MRFILYVIKHGSQEFSAFSIGNFLARIENLSALSGASNALAQIFLLLALLAAAILLVRPPGKKFPGAERAPLFFIILFLLMFALSSISYDIPQKNDLLAFSPLFLLLAGAVLSISTGIRLSERMKGLVVLAYFLATMQFLMNYPQSVERLVLSEEDYSRLDSFLQEFSGRIYFSDCRAGVAISHFSQGDNAFLRQTNYSAVLNGPEGQLSTSSSVRAPPRIRQSNGPISLAEFLEAARAEGFISPGGDSFLKQANHAGRKLFVFSRTQIPPGTDGVKSNGPVSLAEFLEAARAEGFLTREFPLPGLEPIFITIEAYKP
ncbi:MAG: hypothetical protein V1820_02470 [archaeon]